MAGTAMPSLGKKRIEDRQDAHPTLSSPIEKKAALIERRYNQTILNPKPKSSEGAIAVQCRGISYCVAIRSSTFVESHPAWK